MPTLQAWLEDPSAIRGIFVLANVNYFNGSTWGETTKYLSSVGYITTDSTLSFDPIIKQGVKFTESLSLKGGASVSFGDIEIDNFNGELDDWLLSSKHIWVNREVKIYVGDPSWASTNLANFQSTFYLIFDGIIEDIDSRSRESLNIKLRDKLFKLNTPVTEAKLGTYGTWAGDNNNAEAIKPLIFGEVHNVQPLMIDPAQLEYMLNNGAMERIIEIRDNGVPIYTDTGLTGAITTGATINTTAGTFKLNYQSYGEITASAQGVKRRINLTTGATESFYSNNIANLIALIVKEYGKDGYKLTISSDPVVSEVDLTNFSAFAAANTQSVGIQITDKQNVIQVIQQLADSVGAQVFMNRYGKLQLLRIDSYTSDTPVTITDADILHHTLRVSERTEVVAATKLNYCKNWSVQAGLLTGIQEQHKRDFAEEWWLANATVDATIKSRYRLNEEPEAEDSLLVIKSEAVTEANRRNTFNAAAHTVYKFMGAPKLMSLALGQQVTLIHNRFDLYNGGSGRTGQVISISPDWINAQVELEVLV
jgi:hypothetical protein